MALLFSALEKQCCQKQNLGRAGVRATFGPLPEHDTTTNSTGEDGQLSPRLDSGLRIIGITPADNTSGLSAELCAYSLVSGSYE